MKLAFFRCCDSVPYGILLRGSVSYPLRDR